MDSNEVRGTNTNTAPTALPTFQVGQVLQARSACDWDCVFTWTVVSRTAKFMTLDDGHGLVRVGVKVSPDGEWVVTGSADGRTPCSR